MTPKDRIKTLIDKHNMSLSNTATYLGVPINTIRKWVSGERKPPSVLIRLLDILGMIEILAPDIHSSLIERSKK